MKKIFFILNIIILLFFQNVKSLIVIPFRVNTYIAKENNKINVTDLINECLIVNLYTNVEMGNPPQKITSILVQEENTFTLSSQLCQEKQLESIADYSIVSKKGIDLTQLNYENNPDLLNSEFNNYLNEEKNVGFLYQNIFLFNTTFLSSQPADIPIYNKGNPNTKKEIKNITMIIKDYKKGQKLCGRIGLGSPEKITGGQKKLRDIPSFIKALKNENIINDYSYTFKFYYRDEGRFIIGAKPHEYENQKNAYSEERFVQLKSYEPFNVDFPWSIRFNSIYFTDSKNVIHNIQTNLKSIFSPNLGFIIAEEAYKREIIKVYFQPLIDKKICFVEKTQITNFTRTNYKFGTNGIYEVIHCNNSITTFRVKFPKLNFEYKEQNALFTLTFNDLFQERDGTYIFLVIFPDNYYNINHSYWYLGIPFYKAYQLVFNYDSKTIGVYLSKKEQRVINEDNNGENNKTSNIESDGNEKNKSRNVMRILLEILFGICLVIIAYFIGKKINEQRKKRANELQDDYEYCLNNKNDINDKNGKDKNTKTNLEMTSAFGE